MSSLLCKAKLFLWYTQIWKKRILYALNKKLNACRNNVTMMLKRFLPRLLRELSFRFVKTIFTVDVTVLSEDKNICSCHLNTYSFKIKVIFVFLRAKVDGKCRNDLFSTWSKIRKMLAKHFLPNSKINII